MPPTPPLVTIAIPLTVVPVPLATVEVVTVRVVAITVARVGKEEDITVAKVAKEDTVEEETRVAPFTTVGAVPPLSTPPIRTGVTMDVAEITATRTAMAVAMDETVIIMGTARRTTITGVATLFDSFLSSRGQRINNQRSLSFDEEGILFHVYVFMHYLCNAQRTIHPIHSKKVILRNNGKKESKSGGMCCVIRYLSITMTQYLISRYIYIYIYLYILSVYS